MNRYGQDTLVDWPDALGLLPAGDLIGAGQDNMSPGSGFKAKGRVGCATGFDHHRFAIDPVAKKDSVSRGSLRNGLGQGLPGPFGCARPVIAGLGVTRRHVVRSGREGSAQGEQTQTGPM